MIFPAILYLRRILIFIYVLFPVGLEPVLSGMNLFRFFTVKMDSQKAK